jgi:hypothetical protein
LGNTRNGTEARDRVREALDLLDVEAKEKEAVECLAAPRTGNNGEGEVVGVLRVDLGEVMCEKDGPHEVGI